MTDAKPNWSRDKERTLLAAWLLAAWSPVTYGIAVSMGQSTLMFADLLRRSVELLSLFAAWLVYWLGRRRGVNSALFTKWERQSSAVVAVALGLSAIVVAVRAVGELQAPQPVDRVWLGIILATLGVIVNGWFWRKHRRLAQEGSSSMFESQWRLFRSKTLLDSWVVINLSLSSALRHEPWALVLDPAGSLLLAVVLAVSALQVVRLTQRAG